MDETYLLSVSVSNSLSAVSTVATVFLIFSSVILLAFEQDEKEKIIAAASTAHNTLLSIFFIINHLKIHFNTPHPKCIAPKDEFFVK